MKKFAGTVALSLASLVAVDFMLGNDTPLQATLLNAVLVASGLAVADYLYRRYKKRRSR